MANINICTQIEGLDNLVVAKFMIRELEKERQDLEKKVRSLDLAHRRALMLTHQRSYECHICNQHILRRVPPCETCGKRSCNSCRSRNNDKICTSCDPLYKKCEKCHSDILEDEIELCNVCQTPRCTKYCSDVCCTCDNVSFCPVCRGFADVEEEIIKCKRCDHVFGCDTCIDDDAICTICDK